MCIITPSLPLPPQAAIGVVQLQILRTHEPLLVNANPHQSGTTHLTLKNASSFPLHISLSVKDESQAFSLHPSSLTMPPGACSSPALFFTPGGHVGTLNRYAAARKKFSIIVTLFPSTSLLNPLTTNIHTYLILILIVTKPSCGVFDY